MRDFMRGLMRDFMRRLAGRSRLGVLVWRVAVVRVHVHHELRLGVLKRRVELCLLLRAKRRHLPELSGPFINQVLLTKLTRKKTQRKETIFYPKLGHAPDTRHRHTPPAHANKTQTTVECEMAYSWIPKPLRIVNRKTRRCRTDSGASASSTTSTFSVDLPEWKDGEPMSEEIRRSVQEVIRKYAPDQLKAAEKKRQERKEWVNDDALAQRILERFETMYSR
jgi:hypothetical protein